MLARRRGLGAWLLALGLLFVGGLACTVDDIEEKKCEPGTSDPAKQCIQGYSCACRPEGCYCRKKSSLQSSSPGLEARSPTRSPPSCDLTRDPNREFLRRLGVIAEP